MFYNILFYLIVIIYGALSMLAGTVQLKNGSHKGLTMFFIFSSLVMLISLLFTNPIILYILITGLVLLHISAILFGLKDKFHLSHHIIRLFVSILIVILYLNK